MANDASKSVLNIYILEVFSLKVVFKYKLAYFFYMKSFEVENQIITDPRGNLLVLEALKNVPFEIKRIYVLLDSKLSKGFHAHKKLKQMMICLAGQCEVVLDDGERQSKISLNSYSQAILINPVTWREMHHMSEDCVLMVLADQYYDEADYLRTYEEFKNYLSLTSHS